MLREVQDQEQRKLFQPPQGKPSLLMNQSSQYHILVLIHNIFRASYKKGIRNCKCPEAKFLSHIYTNRPKLQILFNITSLEKTVWDYVKDTSVVFAKLGFVYKQIL